MMVECLEDRRVVDANQAPTNWLPDAQNVTADSSLTFASWQGNQVSISAEVKRETEKKEGDRVLRSERYCGSSYRSFVLPSDIDEAASEAKYDNGVLELKLAKKAAVTGRKLAIS